MTKSLKWPASAALAIAMLPALQAEPHCPGNVASIRPRLVNRVFMIVPVMLDNSGPYDFVVDTAAQITTIDLRLAAELQPERLAAVHVTGVGVYAQAEFGQLELLQAGIFSMKQPLIVIQDLRGLQQVDTHIRGVLGENFLEHFDLLIDYGHGILCLDNTKQMQQSIKGTRIALAPPPFPERNLPFTQPMLVLVKVPDVAPQPLLLQLDSGVDLPVLFTSRATGLPHEMMAVPQLHSKADKVMQVFAYLPPHDIKVGDRSFHQISFVVPAANTKDFPVKKDVDGLLPTRLFRRVFISYADGYAVLDAW